MTKPWEEEWGLSDGQWIEVVTSGDRVTIGRFDVGRGGLLASKAPKMARALLDDVKGHARSPEPTHSCGCRKCALLREAGVLE